MNQMQLWSYIKRIRNQEGKLELMTSMMVGASNNIASKAFATLKCLRRLIIYRAKFEEVYMIDNDDIIGPGEFQKYKFATISYALNVSDFW